ncbi:unnamed protein product [Lactuca virosa]|uniref:Protein kinase domain-containing protein n=1 Tax=Lactuca virosa TaxID=75947 RepID=A0AAU9MKJ7_9ASTR|nr:unnamed protein product [Lactuca virosa]
MEAYLNWNKRCEVILRVANALNYFHNHAPIRVIHADVRPQNLLFNESLDHRLSYLGSARHLAINKTDYVIVDTVYVTTGNKDFYYQDKKQSTGKETAQGTKIDKRQGRAWANWLEGTCLNINDPTIDVDSSLISRFINIGLLCVQANAADRPTMDEVVGMFAAQSNTLPLPKNPVSSWMIEEDSDYANGVSDDYDVGAVEEFVSELSPR